MIELKKLGPQHVGAWVRYRTPDRVEYGRLKSWVSFSPTSHVAFVVYHSDNRWEDFEHFTAESTDPEQLSLMTTYCPKDRALLLPGRALQETYTGTGDFREGDRVVTMSVGGGGQLVDCLKCPTCGFSIL